MTELIQATLTVVGEVGDRWYTVELRWNSGLREQVVVLEKEFPKMAARIQKAIDDTQAMGVVERLRYLQEYTQTKRIT